MASSTPRPDDDDEPLSDADRAALERAAAEPGVVMTADEFAALLDAAGDDAEPRDAFGLTEAAVEAALVRTSAAGTRAGATRPSTSQVRTRVAQEVMAAARQQGGSHRRRT